MVCRVSFHLLFRQLLLNTESWPGLAAGTVLPVAASSSIPPCKPEKSKILFNFSFLINVTVLYVFDST